MALLGKLAKRAALIKEKNPQKKDHPFDHLHEIPIYYRWRRSDQSALSNQSGFPSYLSTLTHEVSRLNQSNHTHLVIMRYQCSRYRPKCKLRVV